jgi:hypothetical protein
VKIEPLRLLERSVEPTRDSAPVSSQRQPHNQDATRLTHALLPPLEIGQEIGALVVEAMADGRVLLDIGGALVDADNPGGLHAGQTLRLHVDQLEPQLSLHIVARELAPEDQLTKFLRQRLPLGAEVSLTDLQTIIESLDGRGEAALPRAGLEKLARFVANLVDSENPWSAERLLQFVRDGGLHYEMKLLRAVAEKSSDLAEIADNDLKGLLIGALQRLETAGLTGDLLDGISRKLNDIEGQQAANLLAQLEGQAFQLRIPLFTGAGFVDAAISIEADGAGAGAPGRKKPGYKILFALELENFGRLRIDAFVKDQDLRAIFYSELEDSLSRIKAALPDLQTSLLDMSYRGIQLVARPLRDITAVQQRKFSALALGVPPDVQLINVKV